MDYLLKELNLQELQILHQLNLFLVFLFKGKYVYVRGLGDRYTKSILNGVDIPGLDPERNTIQMDIFPTNILDNVTVIKSASAEMPADLQVELLI